MPIDSLRSPRDRDSARSRSREPRPARGLSELRLPRWLGEPCEPKPRRVVAAVLAAAMLTACVPQRTEPPAVPVATPASAAPATAQHPGPDRPQTPLADVDLPGMKPPPPGMGMARYTGQQLTWTACDGGLQCADVLAPMDHADPDRKAITLHLVRRPAAGTRTGAVLVNPGGPGEPGTGLVRSGRFAGMTGLDIVGWDPRGTGASTPIVCEDAPGKPNPSVDRVFALDGSPDNDAEWQALLDGERALFAGCATHSGRWLEFVGTDQTARDMDLIRALLGEEKLSYVGYSYGTWLGAVYATLFPSHVGRMVLDSPVDVTGEGKVSQAVGFERAFGLFAEWEAPRGKLGRTPDEVRARIREFIGGLDRAVVPVGDRALTETLAATGIAATLYGGEQSWQVLEDALLLALDGKGARLLQLADSLNDRQRDGSYGTRFWSFPAILCRDEGDDGLAAARTRWVEDQAEAPLFGYWFGPQISCPMFPVAPLPRIAIDAHEAAPILVVGSTGDPATPFEYAAGMADALGSGHLLTWDGPGHGSFGHGNPCLDGAVVDYLLRGVVPGPGATCRP